MWLKMLRSGARIMFCMRSMFDNVQSAVNDLAL